MRLTDLQIRKMKVPERGQKTYFDKTQPGFDVRVSQGGSKSFVVVYGKQRKLKTLGRYPEMKLAVARRAFRQVTGELAFTRPDVVSRPTISFEGARERFLVDTATRTKLPRLPTRDAMLPLVAVLTAARDRALSLSALAKTLPARFMKADRIREVSSEQAKEFLDNIIASKTLRTSIDKRLADPVEINEMDGVRMSFADSTIVHFRQSGNAPEMRIYVETGERDLTERLLGEIKHGLGVHLGAGELLHEQ